MKKTQKLFLALVIAVSCGTAASAQIYVHVRPVARIVVRGDAPSPEHVWIHEDWHERNGRYEDNGGRWAAPPAQGYRYHEGHWDHSSRGHTWHEGGWNENHDGGHEGHGNGHGERH